MALIGRPDVSEHPAYYASYIARVPGDDLMSYFKAPTDSVSEVLNLVNDETALFRYAEGKWTIKEVISHIIETERVFAYRILCFSRNDATELAGFDENAYIANGNANSRSVADLLNDYLVVRGSSVALLGSCNDEMLLRSGTANAKQASVRAIAYMIAGHELHHVNVIRERYLPALPKR